MSTLRRVVLVTALLVLGWAAAAVWFVRKGPDGQIWQTYRPITAFTSGWSGGARIVACGQVATIALLALVVAAVGLVISDHPRGWMRRLGILAAATMAAAGAVMFIGDSGDTARAMVPPALFELAAIAAIAVTAPRLASRGST